MTKRQRTVLMCNRIADLLIPEVRAFKDNCHRCGAPIWVAYSSPSVDERICMQCAQAGVGDIKLIGELTHAQIADVAAHHKRKPS